MTLIPPVLVMEERVNSAAFENLKNILVLKERIWTEILLPDKSLENKFLQTFEEYSKKHQGGEQVCSFSVRTSNGKIEIEHRGLFGWLNFGNKDFPLTVVFQPKMMYGLKLEDGTDIDKYSHCLLQMKTISELRNSKREKRNGFVEKVLSKGVIKTEFRLDLLEEIFTSHLEDALSEGISRQYVRRTISHPYLKGKMIPFGLIPDIWVNPGYLKQQVQELSPNILVNQLLSWCCNHLISGNLNDSNLLQRLTVISQRFKRVKVWGRPNDSSLERLENLPVMQSHLQEVVDIAIMIARDEMTLLNHEGSPKASGLVIDANYAFEDFVGFIFEQVNTDVLSTDKTTRSVYGTPTFPNQSAELADKPDIFIPSFGDDGEQISMTFDAKHSEIGKNEIPEGRYRNQTITAAWSRGSEICGLIYPQGNKKEQFNIWSLNKNSSAPNTFALISLNPSLLWQSDWKESQVINLEKQLSRLYKSHQLETLVRSRKVLSKSWDKHARASDFDAELEHILSTYVSGGCSDENCEELFGQLQDLKFRASI